MFICFIYVCCAMQVSQNWSDLSRNHDIPQIGQNDIQTDIVVIILSQKIKNVLLSNGKSQQFNQFHQILLASCRVQSESKTQMSYVDGLHCGIIQYKSQEKKVMTEEKKRKLMKKESMYMCASRSQSSRNLSVLSDNDQQNAKD